MKTIYYLILKATKETASFFRRATIKVKKTFARLAVKHENKIVPIPKQEHHIPKKEKGRLHSNAWMATDIKDRKTYKYKRRRMQKLSRRINRAV
jgi:predicted sulfurtransferase